MTKVSGVLSQSETRGLIFSLGMMAGVNNAKDYYDLMGFGHQDPETGAVVVTNSTLQGGIISVYYLGTLVGALVGGIVGDKYGRIKAIAFGSCWAILGAALQCSAQNASWMICARLINGWGTGVLNSIVPVYATETAEHTSRGQFVAMFVTFFPVLLFRMLTIIASSRSTSLASSSPTGSSTAALLSKTARANSLGGSQLLSRFGC